MAHRPVGQLTDRFRFEACRSGQMTYLRDEDLETANDHIRDFIDEAVAAPGVPALWGRRTPANSGG